MQITDQRPAGVFSKRFWTEPRPATGETRAGLAALLVQGAVGCAISAAIIWFVVDLHVRLALYVIG